ncbi:MAG: HAMP domain-containing sensor histidine kinase [Slackia sp.]|nr:HAMP domain-containing sensor histidine kinase [Slackia sp.]
MEEDARAEYRVRQTKLLRRSLLMKTGACLAAWTVLFAVWLLAVDALIVPRVADFVSAQCPWVRVAPQDAAAESESWYADALREAECDTIVSYVEALTDGRLAREAASDDARALVDACARRGFAYESPADSDDAPPDDREGGAYLKEPSTEEIVRDAADSMRPDRFLTLFEEACAALGTPPETVPVISPWQYDTERGQREVYYADGHKEYWDLRLYDFLRALRIPLASLLYVVGAWVAVWLASGWFASRFERLFAALAGLASDDAPAPELPEEFGPTQRALEEARRSRADAQRAALAAEQRKNELVAYLAHDIRTPLTSVVGYLTLLAEAPDMPEEQRVRYAQVALDRAYRLEGMMEEFFEITRYNLGSIPIERHRFDAALLCEQVADEFYPAAAARSIEIDVRVPGALECFADGEKVSRVLNNLLKNAVAYADAGTAVAVRARIERAETRPHAVERRGPCESDGAPPRAVEDAGSATWLVIEVENRGREISPEHLQAVFEKFYREDPSRAAGKGGAGLGLAIAREIARAHGGDLDARSEAGRTVFTLCVPA